VRGHDGDLSAALPAVLGREPSGDVVEVGAGVDASSGMR
jgi:Zn-dependent alcohol dehydrogenase